MISKDQDLANRLAQCDEDAFTSIYQQFKDRLYQYALCIVGRAMVAEDVVHDVFIKFLKQVADGNIPNNISAYLYMAVKHRAVDMLRRKTEISLDEIEYDFIKAESDDFEKMHLQDFLNHQLAKLTWEQREVLILKIYHGLTFKEIAEMCKTPINTAISRYQYALNNLRKAMEEEWKTKN